MRASRLRTIALLLALPAALVACGTDHRPATDARQAKVRAAGAEVMPFSLDETKHSFVKTDDGGVQTVVALDPSDRTQVRLVREHLRMIRDQFASGDFSSPTAIHGADMPGLKALTAGASRLTITVRDVDGGASLTYRTDDPTLVAAIHEWFDAQLADHGSDAISTPMDHSMTGHSMDGHTMTRSMWEMHHPGVPYPGDTTTTTG